MSRWFNTFTLRDLIKGLWTTIKVFFEDPITVMYPDKERKVHPNYRGEHVLQPKPDHSGHRCVGCGLCEAICPSHCIKVITENGPNGERVVKDYIIDISRCLYCGLCEEVCPEFAIEMVNDNRVILTERKEFYFDAKRLMDAAMKHAEPQKAEAKGEKR